MMTGQDEGIFLGYATNSKGYRCYNKRLHKMVDCIDVKIDEGIPAREVYGNETSTEDTTKAEDEQVQESENEDSESDEDSNSDRLKSVNYKFLLQNHSKESSCKSDNWRKRQRGTNQEKANQNHRTISYSSHIHAGTQEF
jgi:hypothetical protein